MRINIAFIFLFAFQLCSAQNDICCDNFKLIGDENQNAVWSIQGIDNFIYLAGSSRMNNQTFATFKKIDSNDNIVWQYILNEQSAFFDFVATDDGSFLIVGRTEPSNPPTNNQSILMKISSDGIVDFIRMYDNNARELFRRIMKHPFPLNPNAPYYVTASQNIDSSPSFSDKINLHNLDSNGNIIWSTEYSLSQDDQMLDANRPRENGNLLLSGDLGQGNFGILMEVNGATGGVVRSLQAQEVVKFSDFHALGADRFLATGLLTPNNPSGSILTLLDENWEILQTVKLENPNVNNIRRLIQDDQGNFYATGTLPSGEIAIIKFNIVNDQIEITESKFQLGDQSLLGVPILAGDESQLYFAAAKFGYDNGFGDADIFFGKLDFDVQNNCFQDTVISSVSFDLNLFEANIIDFELTLPDAEMNINAIDLNYQITNNCSISIELCDNGEDDDNDGLVDCDDPDLQDSCCCFIPLELDLGDDLFICEGASIILSANNPYIDYVWSTANVTSSIEVNEEATYALTVTDQCGNLFVDEISVSFLDQIESNISLNGCDGDSIIVNAEVYTESGIFQQDLISTNGCDSLLIIDVTFAQSSNGSEEFIFCSGDSVTVNGETYTAQGVFTQVLENIAGCDSTLQITIDVLSVETSNLETSICAGEPVLIAGEEFTTPGLYTVTLENSSGCDSIITISIFDAGCVECDFLDDGMLINLEITKKEIGYTVNYLNKKEEFSTSSMENLISRLISEEMSKNANGTVRKMIKSQTLVLKDFAEQLEPNLPIDDRIQVQYRETMSIIEGLRIGSTYQLKVKL